jgi:hypothetical protein
MYSGTAFDAGCRPAWVAEATVLKASNGRGRACEITRPEPFIDTNFGCAGRLAALARSAGTRGETSQQQYCIVAQQELTTAHESSATAFMGVDNALKGASSVTAIARHIIQILL